MANTIDISTITAEQIASLNHNTLVALAVSIAGLITDSQYDDTDIKETLSTHTTKINEALAKADKLEAFERGEIEEIILKALQDSKLQAIYDGMSVTIDGTPYSVKSVLQAIATSPRVTAQEVLKDTTTGAITGIKLTLGDGTYATLDKTETTSEDGNTKTFSYSGTVKGFNVSKTDIFTKITKDANGIAVPMWHTKKTENLQFDLTPNFVSPFATQTDEEIADINDDSVVGNNQAPIADAGADVSTSINQTVTLHSHSTDDKAITSYIWKTANGTVLAETEAFDFVAPSVSGTETITLTVADAEGATSSDNVIITINAGTIDQYSPTLDLGSYQYSSVPEGENLEFSATFPEPNNIIDVDEYELYADNTSVAFAYNPNSNNYASGVWSGVQFNGKTQLTLKLVARDANGNESQSVEKVITKA